MHTVGIIITTAIVIIVLALIYWKFRYRKKEKFSNKSPDDIANLSKKLFDGTNGKATCSEYKSIVGEDSVMYTDTKKLWKEGNLTPQSVGKIS